jgi:hypothetical protein
MRLDVQFEPIGRARRTSLLQTAVATVDDAQAQRVGPAASRQSPLTLVFADAGLERRFREYITLKTLARARWAALAFSALLAVDLAVEEAYGLQGDGVALRATLGALRGAGIVCGLLFTALGVKPGVVPPGRVEALVWAAFATQAALLAAVDVANGAYARAADAAGAPRACLHPLCEPLNWWTTGLLLAQVSLALLAGYRFPLIAACYATVVALAAVPVAVAVAAAAASPASLALGDWDARPALLLVEVLASCAMVAHRRERIERREYVALLAVTSDQRLRDRLLDQMLPRKVRDAMQQQKAMRHRHRHRRDGHAAVEGAGQPHSREVVAVGGDGVGGVGWAVYKEAPPQPAASEQRQLPANARGVAHASASIGGGASGSGSDGAPEIIGAVLARLRRRRLPQVAPAELAPAEVAPSPSSASVEAGTASSAGTQQHTGGHETGGLRGGGTAVPHETGGRRASSESGSGNGSSGGGGGGHGLRRFGARLLGRRRASTVAPDPATSGHASTMAAMVSTTSSSSSVLAAASGGGGGSARREVREIRFERRWSHVPGSRRLPADTDDATMGVLELPPERTTAMTTATATP